MSKTKVGFKKNGQFVSTIPKSMANAMQLTKGDSLEWLFIHGDVVIRRIR